MPNGTTLEETARATDALAHAALEQPEVVNLQTYVGTASPYNFNGLVRHYYLRRGSERGRHPGQSAAQGRAQPAEPRDRQAGAAAPGPRRRPLRGAHQGGRGSARPAGAPDPGGRGLRPGAGRADRHRAPHPRSLEAHRRRGGCGLVRGRRPAEVPPPGGQGEGRAQRHLRGRHRPHHAGGLGRVRGRPAARGFREGRRAAQRAARSRQPLRPGAHRRPEGRRPQRPAGGAARTGAGRAGG